jgi:hypothetical protein
MLGDKLAKAKADDDVFKKDRRVNDMEASPEIRINTDDFENWNTH